MREGEKFKNVLSGSAALNFILDSRAGLGRPSLEGGPASSGGVSREGF